MPLLAQIVELEYRRHDDHTLGQHERISRFVESVNHDYRNMLEAAVGESEADCVRLLRACLQERLRVLKLEELAGSVKFVVSYAEIKNGLVWTHTAVRTLTKNPVLDPNPQPKESPGVQPTAKTRPRRATGS